MYNINQELIRIIKEKTPEGMNSVDLLYEIIPIRKESLYRRLRGEMPFTLDEATRISVNLEVSLDDLLPHKSKNTYHIKMIKSDLEGGYTMTMRYLYEILNTITNDQGACVYSATNNIPLNSLLKYSTLSKFRIFTHNYQYRKETLPQKMSDFAISPEIRESEISYINKIQQVPVNYIWTKNMMQPFIVDVRYFSEIGLLSKEEVQELKDEALSLLNDMEQDSSSGKMESGFPFTIYLSNNLFDNNCLYAESDSFRSCSVKAFGINLYSSTEPDLCDSTKEWIMSLMKYSVLISKSGIVERVHFFKQQRSLIESL